MLREVLNLPFKVIGKAARAVQDHERRQRSDASDLPGASMAAPVEARSALAVPEDFDPGRLLATVADCQQAMDQGVPFTCIDLRPPAAYERGHLPAAMSTPGEQIVEDIAEIPAGTRILVYGDRSGRGARQVTTFLRFRGLEDAWALDGGFPAWKEADAPTESP